MLGRWFRIGDIYGQTVGWKKCVENRIGRLKEIQQESRGFEDEGLRTRKRKVERVKPERKFTAKSHWQEPTVEPRQNPSCRCW